MSRKIPERFMVWHAWPKLSHAGTWATTRYPEAAVEAVRGDVYEAEVAAARREARREALREAVWKVPADADEGTEMLVKSPHLVDEDYNPLGISAGIISPGSGNEKIALCATWCNYQDHYHTTELPAGTFLVRALAGGDSDV
jgi:hypothetical protein